MPELDINAAITFLEMLDPGGRHTIASEHPTNGPNGIPKWEGGATYEAHQREWLISDIKKRQARGSNVYYGVNRPCSAGEQQGFSGKCSVNDIIAIRALAFDIDLCQDIALIENGLAAGIFRYGGQQFLIDPARTRRSPAHCSAAQRPPKRDVVGTALVGPSEWLKTTQRALMVASKPTKSWPNLAIVGRNKARWQRSIYCHHITTVLVPLEEVQMQCRSNAKIILVSIVLIMTWRN
jgi:hypothetical protein